MARRSSRLRARRSIECADEGEHRLQLRAVEVLAGYVVGERAVEFDAVEFAVGVLFQGADPGVTNALPVDHGLLTLDVSG